MCPRFPPAPAESEDASGEPRGGGGQKDRRDWSRFGGSVQEWASGVDSRCVAAAASLITKE